MIVNRLMLGLLSAVLLIHTTSAAQKTTRRNPVQEAYKDISGFCISEKDEHLFKQANTESLYGEITDEGMEQILRDLTKEGTLNKKTVFYDITAGTGRAAMYTHLHTDAAKTVAIELSPERCALAKKAQKRFNAMNIDTGSRTFELICSDSLNVPMNDATIVYICCFAPEFMHKITRKLASLKPGLTVLTLKSFAQGHEKLGFKHIKTYKVPMSWMSSGASIYRYQLIKQ